jgi:hypothetical protein
VLPRTAHRTPPAALNRTTSWSSTEALARSASAACSSTRSWTC